jgi:CubicO group peptidase (beta-lactamase class C family)
MRTRATLPAGPALLIAGVLALTACGRTHGCAPSPRPASPVTADAWTRITAEVGAFLDRVEALEEYPPGAAVVIVTPGGRRYIRVHGETKTKAYMGLLAARLDVEGVLTLDMTLARIWPNLKLPAGGRQGGCRHASRPAGAFGPIPSPGDHVPRGLRARRGAIGVSGPH